MTWPIRWLISGVMMLCGMVVKKGVFIHPSERHATGGSNSPFPRRHEGWKATVTDPARDAFIHPETIVFLSQAREGEKNPADVIHSSYQTIVERNSFRLNPPVPAAAAPALAVEPREDLFLTGIASNGSRYALFMVTEPGQPSTYFTVREGEENDWLAVKAVDLDKGAVTARLKKRVMRIRNVGADVVLSLDAHGIKNHLYQ